MIKYIVDFLFFFFFLKMTREGVYSPTTNTMGLFGTASWIGLNWTSFNNTPNPCLVQPFIKLNETRESGAEKNTRSLARK